MSKRTDVLSWIRVAAYHGDSAAMMRLFCENRISRKAYDEAVEAGRRAKADGIGCACPNCKKNLQKPVI